MFSGYLDRPDATAAAIDGDGWFHTGDLASRDADGYLTIIGRRSEGIRSGGEWIAPVEVEAAILTHPAVVEVGVVGLPDDRMGRVGVCGDRRAARRRAADRRRAARAPRAAAGRAEAPAGRRRVDTTSPHRRHRPDPPCSTARARSSPTATARGSVEF